MRRALWFTLGAMAGFVAGLFVAATSSQLGTRLEAERAKGTETPAEAAERERVTAKMRAMGVHVGEHADTEPVAVYADLTELLLEAGVGVLGGIMVALGVVIGVRVYRMGRGDRT